jgi:hypothetical protein
MKAFRIEGALAEMKQLYMKNYPNIANNPENSRAEQGITFANGELKQELERPVNEN